MHNTWPTACRRTRRATDPPTNSPATAPRECSNSEPAGAIQSMYHVCSRAPQTAVIAILSPDHPPTPDRQKNENAKKDDFPVSSRSSRCSTRGLGRYVCRDPLSQSDCAQQFRKRATFPYLISVTSWLCSSSLLAMETKTETPPFFFRSDILRPALSVGSSSPEAVSVQQAAGAS